MDGLWPFSSLGERGKQPQTLKKAVKYLPLVPKELLKTKHRLPRTASQDVVTLGGADQAYYYWEHSGHFWEEDYKALEWLRAVMKSPRGHRGKGQQPYLA
jgi:hypothetical protein